MAEEGSKTTLHREFTDYKYMSDLSYYKKFCVVFENRQFVDEHCILFT